LMYNEPNLRLMIQKSMICSISTNTQCGSKVFSAVGHDCRDKSREQKMRAGVCLPAVRESGECAREPESERASGEAKSRTRGGQEMEILDLESPSQQ
jgi:hypothetical protein